MRYITPEHCVQARLEERPAPNWHAAVLAYRDHSHSQQFLRILGNVRPVDYGLLYNLTSAESEPTVFEADVSGQRIVVVTKLVWGGPQTAIVVEELACLGVRFLLGYGVAGSMTPDLPRGHLVVARSVLPTDGTSKAYGASSELSTEDRLVQMAVACAAEAGCEMEPVTAVTVDALYRETPELIDGFRRQGGQVVQMEASPLYAVSRVCGARSLWLGYVTDCLEGEGWQDWYADLGDAGEKASRICLGLLEAVLSD